ncbi:MAG: nuclear transport factor 2 family protein [Acidobacteriota bacterium]
MNKFFAGLVTMLVFAGAAIAQNQAPSIATSAASTEVLAEARRAIDKGNAQWVEAWAKGDPSLTASLFTDDGVMLASKGRLIKGRQSIFERQKAAMAGVEPGVKVTVTTVDVWLDGDTAYETGKYKYEYKEKGKPGIDEGRYVTMWKRQKDGSWKLVMDMGVPQD